MRKILTLILAVVLILAIAACGKQKEESSSYSYEEMESMIEEIQKHNSVSQNSSKPAESSKVESVTESIIESDIESETESKVESETESSESQESEIVSESESNSNELRTDFIEAMDAYEAFYDEYCELLVEYNENPMDLTLLGKYTDMLNKASEMDEKFEAWDEDELNDAELKYYLDVNNRVMKKLLDAESEMLG